MHVFKLIPGQLTLADIRLLSETTRPIALDKAAWGNVALAEQMVAGFVQTNQTIYGVNTGFGLLAHTAIPVTSLRLLQHHLLRSHAAGVGEHLPAPIVKLILLFKINSLARGYSGVRRVVIERLIQYYNQGIYPCIPCKGSVGASGDLAPLAHLSLALIGEGTVQWKGRVMPAHEALNIQQEAPLELAPKEGLALINGTQASTAIAIYHWLHAQRLLASSIAIGAMSVDAALGSDTPFYPAIHHVRGQRGQIQVARLLFEYLEDSEIRASHQHCTQIQDPYSLRCQPQVIGASLDNLDHVGSILIREANAVTDNPLIFTDTGMVLSGGNFHAEPVAQAADLLAIALSEVGAIAERRLALLVDPHFNRGLPAFLVHQPGLNSGFMIAHATAAALASANKSLAHPASVDSIPTSANQEDHVSMATYAAYRLKDIVENVHNILTIELLAACQGLDLRQPLKSSAIIMHWFGLLRAAVPFLADDRFFARDIEQAAPVVDQIGNETLPRLAPAE